MPSWFLYAFVALVVIGVAARIATRGRPRRPAGPAGWAQVALVAVGALGLAYHCGAMFYPGTFDGALSLGGLAGIVQRLQEGSMVAYSIPAFLVVAGLARRTPEWFVLLVAAALVAVGITMYDGGPLNTHLTAIFVAVAVLALGVPLLMPFPGAGGPGRRTRAGTAVTA